MNKNYLPAVNQDPQSPTRRRSSILMRVGTVAAIAGGVTAGIAGGNALHSTLSGARNPAASAPRFPSGKPNFNPTVNPATGAEYDIELDGTQSVSTLVDGPKYVGYAKDTNSPGVIKLLAGAKVIPTQSGGLEVKPLNGKRKEIEFTHTELEQGPTTISLGGDYALQVGADPASNQPEVFYGPNGQEPYSGTFVGQQQSQ